MRRRRCRSSVLLRTVVVACLAFATEAPAEGVTPFRESTSIRFTNGLTIRLVDYSIFPVTAIAMTYRVGSSDDPTNQPGLAHLVEHILFRGTPGHRTAEELEAVGASFNALTLNDRTIYHATFQTRDLNHVLALEADRMVNVVATAELVDLEKQVIREEGLSIADGIQPADVQDFYRKHYRPDNATLIVVSDVTRAGLIEEFEKVFGPKVRTQARPIGDAAPDQPPASRSVLDEIEMESPAKTALAMARSSLVLGRDEPESMRSERTREIRRARSATFVRRVLSNGMRVLLYSHPEYRTVSIEGYVPAGLHHVRVRPGLASLTAYVMTHIAASSGSSAAVAARFSAVSFNTYLEARVLPEGLPTMVRNIADMLRAPVITEQALAASRARLIEDLERRRRAPAFRAFVAASQRFYPSGNALRMADATEQSASIATLGLKDILAFHRAYYRPEQTILVIVGNFDVTQTLNLLKSVFEPWRVVGAPPKVDLPRVPPIANPGEVHLRDDSARAYLLLTHPGLLRRRDPDYYASLVANSVLGASVLSSRLGQELRGRNASVYDVRSEFFEATLADGLWGVTLDVSGEKAAEAITSVKEVIRTFVASGVTQRELAHHRDSVQGAFAVSLSIPLALAGRILDAEFFGLGKEYLRRFERELGRLDLNRVNQAVRKHFHPNALLTVRVGR